MARTQNSKTVQPSVECHDTIRQFAWDSATSTPAVLYGRRQFVFFFIKPRNMPDNNYNDDELL